MNSSSRDHDHLIGSALEGRRIARRLSLQLADRRIDFSVRPSASDVEGYLALLKMQERIAKGYSRPVYNLDGNVLTWGWLLEETKASSAIMLAKVLWRATFGRGQVERELAPVRAAVEAALSSAKPNADDRSGTPNTLQSPHQGRLETWKA